MNLTSPKEIKELLAKYHAQPSKRMGQNFLISQDVLTTIITAAELGQNDTVLEIGPGIGTLTQALAREVKKVIAVEKDTTMIEILKETLRDDTNVEIIPANILHYKPEAKNYKVVANIPYYITSPVIRKFLELESRETRPSEIILMVQKEVAQRICSTPPNMSLLAVSVQLYAKVKIISYVSKKCFWPSPNVDSAIIKIWDIQNPKTDVKQFFTIVKAGFSHPRKQLVNNLATLKHANGVTLDKSTITEWLAKNNIKKNQRAETLNIQDWIHFTSSF